MAQQKTISELIGLAGARLDEVESHKACAPLVDAALAGAVGRLRAGLVVVGTCPLFEGAADLGNGREVLAEGLDELFGACNEAENLLVRMPSLADEALAYAVVRAVRAVSDLAVAALSAPEEPLAAGLACPQVA